MCECGLSPPTAACCGRYLDGNAKPETAEALMRSRYTAYALENVGYIIATHASETADRVDPVGIANWARSATFQALEIVSAEKGTADDEDGIVEFIARYEQDGRSMTHHERSQFFKKEGSWYYWGEEERKAPKVGRNDPCPCKSGKKYKKCCGRKRSAKRT